jgi:formin-binding protein 1
MFLQHNAIPVLEPPNLVFEPSPVWHDEATIVTDESAKVFLRNLLLKSKAQAKELKMDADTQKREVEGAKRMRENVRQGKEKRDEVEVVRAIFLLQEKLHDIDRRRLTAEVETSTIIAVVGDVSLGAKNHNFRAQTFKIPTNCDLCGERIWGLSAKGFDCRDCGYTCHSKCELKVPADCPGEQSKEERRKLKAERQEQAQGAPVFESSPNGSTAELPSLNRKDTMNSLSSGYATSAQRLAAGTLDSSISRTETIAELAGAPSPKAAPSKRNRILAPPPSGYASASPVELPATSKPSEPRARMVYSYQASGEGEITIDEGRELVVIDPDGKPLLSPRLGFIIFIEIKKKKNFPRYP